MTTSETLSKEELLEFTKKLREDEVSIHTLENPLRVAKEKYNRRVEAFKAKWIKTDISEEMHLLYELKEDNKANFMEDVVHCFLPYGDCQYDPETIQYMLEDYFFPTKKEEENHAKV
jgi:hypothetical protein